MKELQQYDWPGNVRELENVIIRAAVLSPGTDPVVEGLRPVEARPEPASNDYDSLSLEEIIRGKLEGLLPAHPRRPGGEPLLRGHGAGGAAPSSS